MRQSEEGRRHHGSESCEEEEEDKTSGGMSKKTGDNNPTPVTATVRHYYPFGSPGIPPRRTSIHS